MRTEPFDWTDDRIARLKELWASGMSASAIADAFEVSRNAVLGKIHRLGLSGRVVVKKAASAVSVSASQKPRGRRGGVPGQRVRALEKNSTARKAHEEKALPAPTFIGAKPFADLQPGECAFPLGDGDMRCGAPTLPGRDYCQYHADMCCGGQQRRRRTTESKPYVAIGKFSGGMF